MGAQLIANSLGSRVYPNAHKEIGWFPVERKNSGSFCGYPLPENFVVFHWHGETFDLPEGAQLLLSSEACPNQMFSIGTNVLALQCHPEVNSEAITEILETFPQERETGPFIQSKEEIEQGAKMYSKGANQVLFSLLKTLKEQH